MKINIKPFWEKLSQMNFRKQIMILVLGLVIFSTSIISLFLSYNIDRNPINVLIYIGIVFSITIILTWFFSKGVTHRLNKILILVQKIENGDLSEIDINISRTDEVGQLEVNLKKTIDKMRFMLKQIAYSAELVSEASGELQVSSGQSAQASTQIAVATQEVATGTEDQSMASEKTKLVVQQMAIAMDDAVNSVNNVVYASEKTAKAAYNGGDYIRKVIEQMERIDKSTQIVEDAVTRLNSYSSDIGQIIDTISTIASQTNLLALNAAIEAARARDQGKGFAVVAEEVRLLAEQSQTATQKISVIIKHIKVGTEQAVMAIHNESQEVKNGTTIVGLAGNSFNEINDLVHEVSVQISGISTTIQEMVNNSKFIVNEVNSINSVSKNIARNTQTVLAATEEQSASMEEIATFSKDLSYMAREVQGAVDLFEIWEKA
jgi:Methyl-accepting chemotaxis protein